MVAVSVSISAKTQAHLRREALLAASASMHQTMRA